MNTIDKSIIITAFLNIVQCVLSNVTPYRTFLELLEDPMVLPKDFYERVQNQDYACGAFKINCAVDELPSFKCNVHIHTYIHTYIHT